MPSWEAADWCVRVMERTMAILTRVGWHTAFWSLSVSALAIVKHRLGDSWNERTRDSLAADLIQRHFECSWEEGEGLLKTLLLDLQRKLSSLFPVEATMERLDSISGPADEVRSRKIACWGELKVQAIAGKTMYLRTILKDKSPVLPEDLAAANRIFVCLAGRFIQHGTTILGESVQNAVRAVFGKVSLQESCGRVLLDSLLLQVRHEVETACGKNVMDDCMFGRIEDMIGADISPIRRRLFIAMVSEARAWMKTLSLKAAFYESVKAGIDKALISALSHDEPNQSIRPFIGIIPKLSLCNQEIYSRPPRMSEYRTVAARIFVDTDSNVNSCFLTTKGEYSPLLY